MCPSQVLICVLLARLHRSYHWSLCIQRRLNKLERWEFWKACYAVRKGTRAGYYTTTRSNGKHSIVELKFGSACIIFSINDIHGKVVEVLQYMLHPFSTIFEHLLVSAAVR